MHCNDPVSSEVVIVSGCFQKRRPVNRHAKESRPGMRQVF
jgi:hypothetical protein